jgi:Na+-translocating ferredoxin:NAD+ oxidoreductase RnfG subunit
LTKIKNILLIILFIPLLVSANGIKEKTEGIIRSEFGDNVHISFKKIQIPIKVKNKIELAIQQRFFDTSVFLWKISQNDSLIAIGLMDNVYGKAQPITFLTIFTLEGNVHSNHIIKYREEHGGQVSNKDWNKQFVGLNKSSKFDEIDGISGATISVNSIKKGVKKLMFLFENIVDKQMLRE